MEIDYVIKILDLVIKISATLGILVVSFFYCFVSDLERQIDIIRNSINEEIKKNEIYPEKIISGRETIVDILKKEKDSQIEPLERKRQRILSKIPFLKS